MAPRSQSIHQEIQQHFGGDSGLENDEVQRGFSYTGNPNQSWIKEKRKIASLWADSERGRAQANSPSPADTPRP